MKKRKGNYFILIIVSTVFAVSSGLIFPLLNVSAHNMPCPPFYLRTEEGKIINPHTGENADQPYSTRQTCGQCHEYDKITKGYHFQMGWDSINDNYSQTKPWNLSDGMMGTQ